MVPFCFSRSVSRPGDVRRKKRREYIIFTEAHVSAQNRKLSAAKDCHGFSYYILCRDVSDLTMYLTPSAQPAHPSYLKTNWAMLSHVASNCGNGGTCCLLLLHEHLESSLHGFGTFRIDNDILLISTQQIFHKCGMDKGGDLSDVVFQGPSQRISTVILNVLQYITPHKL